LLNRNSKTARCAGRFFLWKKLVAFALQRDTFRVRHVFILGAALCLFGGCQAVEYAFRDELDSKSELSWSEKRARWELEDARFRYQDGTLDRYGYNVIRKRHGLRPVH
jgi:hypothetical protein